MEKTGEKLKGKENKAYSFFWFRVRQTIQHNKTLGQVLFVVLSETKEQKFSGLIYNGNKNGFQNDFCSQNVCFCIDFKL